MVVIMSSLWYKTNMATIHRLMDSSDEEDEIGEMINPMTGKIKSRKTYIQRGPENYHHSGGACGTDTVMPEYFNKITTKIPKRMPENRMFKKTELKDKIITDCNNNMIITNENLFGDMVLPMNMVYNENGKKKPSYPQRHFLLYHILGLSVILIINLVKKGVIISFLQKISQMWIDLFLIWLNKMDLNLV